MIRQHFPQVTLTFSRLRSGEKVQRPLAAVVIGSVLTSTFLTLLLLPFLFARYANK
jgi:Cu/Ag efflux pump CusA